MNKDWVHLHRLGDDYLKGVRAFISTAMGQASFDGKLKCPCRKCYNQYWREPQVIEAHLTCEGMDPDYVDAPWVDHGELLPSVDSTAVDVAERLDNNRAGVNMYSLINDGYVPDFNPNLVQQEAEPSTTSVPTLEAQKFYALLNEANEELYPSSGTKKLEFLVEMFQAKVLHGWTDVSFSAILKIIKKYFPMCENLPSNLYRTKKLINSLGLSYNKIDACPNNCMLFWKTHSKDTICEICGANRYKANGSRIGKKSTKVPQKVLRYFPIGPKLQQLYMSRYTAEYMIWHSEMRTKDGVLRHPADSPAWHHLDNTYPDFGRECRNVRLGLASDGFNPFGTMSNKHSTWPVVLSVYNLPPWMCMKQPYLILALIIPGPRSPSNNIDIFMQPFIDELKELWSVGLDTYDGYKRHTFTMRAAILWTINDFPAYDMLSGWSTKGKKACPHCGDNTNSLWLKNGGKYAYMGHRKWLPMSHWLRKQRHSFNGQQEFGRPPNPLSGIDCVLALAGLTFNFGMGAKVQGNPKRKRTDGYNGLWKKKTIFFELPYWNDLLIRHNLNVMHIEKNITESVIGTLLMLDGKSKDGAKARADLVHLNIKHNLHPNQEGGRTKIRAAPYSMHPIEKNLFCRVLKFVRVPHNFSSNVANCVNMQEKKVTGLKSHDCHVLMQTLLPLAIRRTLPKEVVKVFLELSNFFRNLCSKNGTVNHFKGLSDQIALTLCNLEKIMLPAFFDFMVHLPIHLEEEAAIAGPVHYRWMYPIERYLRTLKGYVRNRSRPEGCIAEGCKLEECLSFYSMYLGDSVVTHRNRSGRNFDADQGNDKKGISIFKSRGRPLSTADVFHLDHEVIERAHRCVLFNCAEMKPYLRIHETEVVENRPRRRTLYEAQREAHASFAIWCRNNVKNIGVEDEQFVQDDLRALAVGPSHWACRYSNYLMNGFRFRVRSIDSHGKYQHSGVYVASEGVHYSSKHDRNPRVAIMDYYGVLKDVIELDYHHGRKVILFDCDWVDGRSPNRGVKHDAYGFTLVNFQRLSPPDDPFVLGTQALQCFYVEDPIEHDWHVCIKTVPRDLFDMNIGASVQPLAPQDLEDSTSLNDTVESRQDVEPFVLDEAS